MSKAEYFFSVGLAAVAVAAGFLFGGPIWGFVFLAVAIICFFLWFKYRAEERENQDLTDLFGGEPIPGASGTEAKDSLVAEMRGADLVVKGYSDLGMKLRNGESLLPKITVPGFEYPDLQWNAQEQMWMRGWGSKGLAFSVRNDMDDSGRGVDAFGVRAQVLFRYANGFPGSSFSALPWVDEKCGIVDIPAGTEKSFIIGIECPGGKGSGWMGYSNSRLAKDEHPKQLHSTFLPDTGIMTVKVIGLVGDEPMTLHESYHDWRIDYGTNHPFFTQITKPQ
jgi:hypothetical protein